jgi:hypothetical protein
VRISIQDWLLLIVGILINYAVENGSMQPLLLNSEAEQVDENEDRDYDDSEESAEIVHKPVTSIVSAYRLLTPSVKVQETVTYCFLISLIINRQEKVFLISY